MFLTVTVIVIETVIEIAIVIVNASSNFKTLNFYDPLNYRSLNVIRVNLTMLKPAVTLVNFNAGW